MTIASNSHPGPTDNLPGKASHRQPTASNAITAGHRGSRVCGSIILVTAIFHTGHQTRPPDPPARISDQKILPCECLDRLPTGLRRVSRSTQIPGTESWRDSPVEPVIRSDSDSSGSLLPQPHPAHNCHEILPEAESSIRRQYRFGSCRRKQQSTRDGCGEALLDTERGEMVRSQRGTVV
jgi:hypothetical protein